MYIILYKLEGTFLLLFFKKYSLKNNPWLSDYKTGCRLDLLRAEGCKEMEKQLF